MATFLTRSAGVLLHPTSLPSPFGIGDLGPAAHHWIDRLADAGQSVWQILPLGPTGYGDSPYQCFSAFAGNPYLISPELLIQDGLFHDSDLAADANSFPASHVDYGRVIPFKVKLMRWAWENFQAGRAGHLRAEFEQFCYDQASWLDDYALFMSLKDAHNGAPWSKWPDAIRRAEPDAMNEARSIHADAIQHYQFAQFLFHRQWASVRQHANERGIKLLGDAPIFVSFDSADVWANSNLFLLDEERRPTAVAGVPPDYFSPTGQLWGNPLYNWEEIARTGYRWWVERVRALIRDVDLVRLDHFRGFAAAWHVPASDQTAENGEWVPGPGAALFEKLGSELGSLPIVAEDLGEITPDVYELRDQFNLPGMLVLQFAFGDTPANPFLPHNHVPNTIAYTGTHDNDTTLGWYRTMPDEARHMLHRYTNYNGEGAVEALIRLTWMSVSCLAVVPIQDVLKLGSEARMNFPGRPAGNWQWRLTPGQFDDHAVGYLADLTYLFGRQPKPTDEA